MVAIRPQASGAEQHSADQIPCPEGKGRFLLETEDGRLIDSRTKEKEEVDKKIKKMQSLGLKMGAGLNPNLTGRRNHSQRERALFTAASASNSSDSSNSGEDGKEKIENAGAGALASSSSFLSRSQTYALLKQQMAVAAKFEDYKEAARIRASLKSFEEEPVLRLRRLMKEAIEEERFEDADRYRDELKDVAPHPLLKCSSDATTLGIRVQVRSVY